MTTFTGLFIIVFALLAFGYILIATVDEYRDIVAHQEGKYRK